MEYRRLLFMALRRVAMLLCTMLVALCMHGQTATGDSVRLLPSAEVTARQGIWRSDRPDLWQQADARQMERSGLWGVADVAKQFAGVAVRDYGGIGGMKTVSIRGAGACHTAVSYGGIVVSNTQAGQIDIGRFSTSSLESVGVAMGQGSHTLLSARHLASAAVLEMNPKNPLSESRERRSSLQLSAGSYGFVDVGLSHTVRLSQAIGLSATVFYSRADGNYPFTLHNGRLTTREKRQGSDVEALKGELTMAALTRHGSVDACLNYYRSERGLPGSVILYVNNAHERLWDEHWSAQSVWQTRLSPHWRLAVRGKYAHSWNKYDDVDVKYEGGRRTDQYHQSEYYAAASVEWTPLDWLRLTLADDLTAATLKSNVADQPDPLRLSSLTAVRLEANLGPLKADAYAVLTLMADHSRSSKEAKASSVSLSETVPQPSLGLSYRLLRSENLFVRGRMKFTFRVPTFTDMYYLHIGNTGLKPERARLWSLGLAWTKSLGQRIDFSLACDAYINNVSDKIVIFPTTYVWRMRNIGIAHIRGVDFAGELTARLSRSLEIAARGAYTYQDARDKTDRRQALYNLLLPYSPHHQGSASLTVSYRRVALSYQLLFSGSRYSSQQNTAEYEISPYQEHSLTLSGRFSIRKTRLTASLSVLNLTDSQYEVVKYYPMPGRNVRATVKVEF